ncbi:response regulator [Marinifilum sp. JC120]|nr:response regulator [Marinifilum sp. JC120]
MVHLDRRITFFKNIDLLKTILFFLLSLASIAFTTWLLLYFTDTYNAGPSVHSGKVYIEENTLHDKVLHLNGQWLFYPDAYVSPQESSTYSGTKGYMTLPGLWKGQQFGKTIMGSKGYGTFQLKIINRGEPRNIELYFPVAPIEAYRVYANNELAFSVGKPGGTAQDTIPEYAPRLFSFFLEKELTLTIQVASFTYQEGGYYKPILLGKAGSLSAVKLANHSKDVFLLGLTAMMFLLFVMIVTKAPKDNYVLFCLALMTVFSACYISATGNMTIRSIIPSIPFKAYYVMYYVLSIAGGTLYLHLIDSIYPDRVSRKIRIISILKAALLFGVIFFFDKHLIGPVAMTKDILLLFEFMYGLYVLSKALASGVQGALLVLLGSVVVLSCVMFDILYVYGVTFSDYELYTPGGLVFLVLCFAVIAAKKYERTLHKTELLTQNLKRANEVKDQLLTNTSHELRTPINSMIALLKSLSSERTKLGTAENESMDMVLSSMTRLNRLINDLLDFSNLKDGRVKLHNSNFNIKQTLGYTVREVQPLLDDKRIELSLKAASSPELVYGDKYRLIQVLYNLLGNAIKFTPENGRIEISTHEQDGVLYISVSDTGIGITPDKQDRIFNSFEQADESISIGYGGLGIGLSISKEIMQAHGGDIIVESEPGKGSVFTLQLPLKQLVSEELPAETLHTKNQKPYIPTNTDKQLFIQGEKKETIVIIDDDYPNIFAAASVLKPEGYSIKGFVDAEEGLQEILNNSDTVLAIVDLMMPKYSGEELTQKVRHRFNLLECPVIILTAKTKLDGLVDCFEAGANDFLFKPFENEVLKSRVRTLSQLKLVNEMSVENEMRMLQAQINPHFLYNAMNVISDCCYEDGEKAADIIADLSDYLRRSFKFDYKKRQIPLEKELELVNAYLAIQKARFHEKLSYEFNIAESSGVTVIPFAIQTLVENAAAHGIFKKKEGGTIRINGYPVDTGYIIQIEDTGIGISPEELPKILSGERFSGNGIGLSNLQQRVEKVYGTALQVKSTYGQGTSVNIHITTKD